MEHRMRYDYRIDNIRAVAILLVVFAHSVIIYDPDWALFSSVHEAALLRNMKIVCATIHMPIFSWIAGYLFWNKPRTTMFFRLAKNKAKRVLIPYFIFAFFWMIPIKMLVGFSDYREESPVVLVLKGIVLGQNNGHLWYCYFIFLSFMATFLLFRLSEACLRRFGRDSEEPCAIYIVILAVAVLLRLLRNSSIIAIPGISRTVKRFCTHYIWFCFGTLAGAYLDKRSLPNALTVCARYGSVIGFSLLVFGYFQGVEAFSTGISLFGILMLYFNLPSKQMRPLSAISKNSFGIYLFHSPFVYVTFTYFPDIHPVLVLLLNFVFFGAVAFAATSALRRTKLRFALGE